MSRRTFSPFFRVSASTIVAVVLAMWLGCNTRSKPGAGLSERTFGYEPS
jgi:hypothetical protein